MKSGFVSIIGRPNTGKSTLLNTILKTHLAIVSNVAGTTRNAIQGVYNDEDTQIIFIDTPGIHKPQDRLGKLLNQESYKSLDDIDVILFMVDATVPLGKGDKFIVETLNKVKSPVILVLNKIDKLNNEEILNAINRYKDLYDFADIVPISAIKDDNVSRLISVIKKYLTDDIKYYDDETLTNTSVRFIISELVREKILNLTNDEVPHSVTCVTTLYEEKSNIININVDIIVDRDSLKKIIVGHQGSMIKTIGSYARRDIETMLHKQVYLELFVKTIKNWRDKEKYLTELGFRDY
ncbi:MAG: GTPase Era [Tenericutes bacterium]|nr:GTPase Era [Mycoplasmatota bacterium]